MASKAATFTYADTTSTKKVTLPPNSVLTGVKLITDTAYSTGATCDVGISTDADYFVDGATISSAGAATVTLLKPGLQSATASTDIYVKVIPTGSANTTGTSRLVIEYAQL